MKPEPRWPRIQYPSEYAAESIYIHKKIFETFMKKVRISRIRVIGGSGGKLVMEYSTRLGTTGVLELNDLGPLPEKTVRT